MTVKEAKERMLPELDDEFAKDLGEFDTLEALKAEIRKDLKNSSRANETRDGKPNNRSSR